MFGGSAMYGMLLWFEMSSSAFSRGSMIGGLLVGYVETGTGPWRSRGFPTCQAEANAHQLSCPDMSASQSNSSVRQILELC